MDLERIFETLYARASTVSGLFPDDKPQSEQIYKYVTDPITFATTDPHWFPTLLESAQESHYNLLTSLLNRYAIPAPVIDPNSYENTKKSLSKNLGNKITTVEQGDGSAYIHITGNSLTRFDDTGDSIRLYVNSASGKEAEFTQRFLDIAFEEYDLEPYIKFLDTTSRPNYDVSEHRILIYPNSHEQKEQILLALKAVEQGYPRLLQDEVTMTTQPTGIKGVGVTVRSEKEGQSFNGAISETLDIAWQKMLEHNNVPDVEFSDVSKQKLKRDFTSLAEPLTHENNLVQASPQISKQVSAGQPNTNGRDTVDIPTPNSQGQGQRKRQSITP